MTALADRLREATVALREADAESFATAVAELAAQSNPRGPELLAFVKVAFRIGDENEYAMVADLLRRRGVRGENRMKQLWATLAALVLIERFERGPGRRSERGLAADSLAAAAVDVLANQRREPVHPDLVTHARAWRDEVVEYLRLRGGLGNPPEIPTVLSPETPAVDADPQAVGLSAQQTQELVEHVRNLTEWVGRSGTPGRLAALEEQQGLVWWLESSSSAVGPTASAVTTVVRACEELLALTRVLPGPPAARELLTRRLGKISAKPVSLSAIAGKRIREVAPLVNDICVLANGLLPRDGDQDDIQTAEAAEYLYAELVLARMAEGMTR